MALPTPGTSFNKIDIDRELLSPVAREQFAERQALIQDAAEALGLTPNVAAVIGGSGFAAHGIDTRVEIRGVKPFDMDVVASDSHYGEMLRRWQAVHRLGQLFGQPSEGRLDFKHKTKLGELPVAIRFEPFSDAIRDGLGIRVFDELVPSIEVHNGIPTLPIVSLVHSKLTRGSQKDVAGVIKGHIIAYGTDHPVARDQKWQRYVKAAVNEAVHWSKYPGWGKECRKLPGWLGSLIIGNFDHPAFRFSAQSQLRAA